MKEPSMNESAIASLTQLAEPLAALSTMHLTATTRLKLKRNELSVNAYPSASGGLVFVGSPRYDTPTEADLAGVFEVAERAGVIWLKFDPESAVIDGLPVFNSPGEDL
jgi:hypothetical protein